MKLTLAILAVLLTAQPITPPVYPLVCAQTVILAAKQLSDAAHRMIGTNGVLDPTALPGQTKAGTLKIKVDAFDQAEKKCRVNERLR